ncbi:unnamed protein product [Lactuca saligna]|uniref:Uncharacterized protein n=1 Tax=Lactuca saligna TaxID=75948 RepID=A0AA36E8P1_LACSI|nr:unnamed protein product [Lactuca saligna]
MQLVQHPCIPLCVSGISNRSRNPSSFFLTFLSRFYTQKIEVYIFQTIPGNEDENKGCMEAQRWGRRAWWCWDEGIRWWLFVWVIWRITEAVMEGEVGFRWRSKGLRVKEVQGWNKVVTWWLMNGGGWYLVVLCR